MEVNINEVTTLQEYSHQEGYMTNQCVIFASKERCKEVWSVSMWGDQYSMHYDQAIALLIDAGITVVPVTGFAADGFNSEIDDMGEWREHAPGLHFHNRLIMDCEPIEEIYRNGKQSIEGDPEWGMVDED
jgi:hypothetical protein